MYAVIETGGKQYRVEVGTQLEVELLDAKAGDTITLDRVLLVADGETTAIGQPVVADASVSAEVLRQERGDKVISFKYRPKARRRVKKGHRQELLVLRIADIVLNGKSAAEAVDKAQSAAKTERQRLEEAARAQAAVDAALAAKLAAAKAPRIEAAAEIEAKPKTAAKKPAAAKPAAKKPAAAGRSRPRRRPRQPESPKPRPPRRSRAPRSPPRSPRRPRSRRSPAPRRRTSNQRWPTRRQARSSKNGRDSVGQRLGVKAGDGQLVPAGSIIVRQRGMTFLAGHGHRARPRLHRLRDGDRQGPLRAPDEVEEAHPRRARRSRGVGTAQSHSRRPPAGSDPHGRRRRRIP